MADLKNLSIFNFEFEELSLDKLKALTESSCKSNQSIDLYLDLNLLSSAHIIKQLIVIIEDLLKDNNSVLKRPSKYHVNVNNFEWIDVYDLYDLYDVKSHRVAHAIKKLLVPGKRSGNKDYEQDIRDSHWSLEREIDKFK